jgi:hypothetical protein
MKAALYLRVSDPDKGQTTDNQLAQLEEWCEHKGHEITEVYRDDESGRRGRAERSDDDSAHAEIDLVGLGMVLSGLLTVAVGQILQCFVGIEENTRQTLAATEALASSVAPAAEKQEAEEAS